MTITQIIGHADPGDLALADLNLESALRDKVLYEFLHDIGYPSWARGYDTKTLSTGARYVDVTTDTFRQMRNVFIAPNYDEDDGLKYIGDDDSKVLAAMVNTERQKPTAYYLGFTGSKFERIFFDAPADSDYTIAFVFYKLIPSAVSDLDPYIPKDTQWPLVEGLKRHLYRERVGVEDRRFIDADQEYNRWIARLMENPEKASGGKRKYVR